MIERLAVIAALVSAVVAGAIIFLHPFGTTAHLTGHVIGLGVPLWLMVGRMYR